MNLRGYRGDGIRNMGISMSTRPWTIRYSMMALVLALRCSRVSHLSLASISVTLLSRL